MMSHIPYSKQAIDREDIESVIRVLKSDWITQGPTIAEFEAALCKYTGARYAVAVSSGTAALHVACLAAGIKPSDEVITSPMTFAASANCVLYCGGIPVFADIQEDTINIDPLEIKKKITNKTKAIIPVHFSGHPAELKEIRDIAKKKKLVVIEDAAHALGAEYNGSKIGSCKYSDMTILSFHPIKHITTGEGGAILTNNKMLYKTALRLRHHGIVKNHNIGWCYDIPRIGFNYRITDFQCALGISQLKRLDKTVNTRRRLVNLYNYYLSKIDGINMPSERKNIYASYHLYVIRVAEQKRNALYNYLGKGCIITQVNYIPIHLFSYYQKHLRYKVGDFPIAEKYSKECLSLPLFPSLSRKEQLKVINRVKGFSKNEYKVNK